MVIGNCTRLIGREFVALRAKVG
ncbi:hypothetical protein LINPERPRIM_LOCUS6384 [Linum perenne]